MKSLPKFVIGVRMQPLVKLYIKLTNHALYVVCVTKCLHAVAFFHRDIKVSIGKCHRG